MWITPKLCLDQLNASNSFEVSANFYPVFSRENSTGAFIIFCIVCFEAFVCGLCVVSNNLFNPLNPRIIFYRSSGEKLIKSQANSSCVIMSVILMTALFNKALMVTRRNLMLIVVSMPWATLHKVLSRHVFMHWSQSAILFVLYCGSWKINQFVADSGMSSTCFTDHS